MVRLTAMANLPCGLAWVGGHLGEGGGSGRLGTRSPVLGQRVR